MEFSVSKGTAKKLMKLGVSVHTEPEIFGNKVYVADINGENFEKVMTLMKRKANEPYEDTVLTFHPRGDFKFRKFRRTNVNDYGR